MKKIFVLVMLLIIGIPIGFIVFLTVKINEHVLYYEYYVVENNNNIIGYSHNGEYGEIRFRWTNKEVTAGPYSLLVSVDVENPKIQTIFFEKY